MRFSMSLQVCPCNTVERCWEINLTPALYLHQIPSPLKALTKQQQKLLFGNAQHQIKNKANI